MNDKCHGVRISWPWQGYPCLVAAKYIVDGKTYCANHAAVAQKECGKIVKKEKINLEAFQRNGE
jgi:hypothetical protein